MEAVRQSRSVARVDRRRRARRGRLRRVDTNGDQLQVRPGDRRGWASSTGPGSRLGSGWKPSPASTRSYPDGPSEHPEWPGLPGELMRGARRRPRTLGGIAVAVGVLKLDVKKFSHGSRDFRNYIHPYQQLISGCVPDGDIGKVCFQVLKAALQV